jgi:hypothetical protein
MNTPRTQTARPNAKSAAAIAHPRAFRRDHVRTLIEGSAGAPLLLVQAPAGSGKTTVLSFLAEQERSSARWVRLDDGDASLESLVVSIVTAVYGWAVVPPVAVGDAREAARWIADAMQELAVTTLVLDDFERIAGSDAAAALVEAVIERLPPYVRLAVATETPPSFLKRARLRQSVVEIDESDLKFDAEDVSSYFREVHSYAVKEEMASSIARRSNGRAAVVNLVGQLVDSLPRYLRVDFDALPLGAGEDRITLLLREVLSRSGHSPAAAARELLGGAEGTPGGARPVDVLLESLEERHCLVQEHAADPPVLVPHKLLRAVAPGL